MPISLDDIELRSEEVQEALQRPSSWILNSGSSLLLAITLLLILLAAFIRYPDIIPASITISTMNPPIEITVPTGGKLVQMYQEEGAMVSDSCILAEVESQLSPAAIQYLQSLLPQIASFVNHPRFLPAFDDETFVFGELQVVYNELKKECLDYYNWFKDPYRKEHLDFLSKKILGQRKVQDISNEQLGLDQSMLENARESFKMQDALYKGEVISRADFLKAETIYFQEKQKLVNLKKAIAQAELTIQDLEKQLLDSRFEQAEAKRNFEANLQLKLAFIQNELDRWQRNFLIRTPISGKLLWTNKLSPGKFLQKGEKPFSVIPIGEKCYGILKVPARRFGKVKLGQQVHIKLDNYPYQEYGYLTGRIHAINPLLDTEEGNYRVEVQLDNGLKTNYNLLLPFRPEMMGMADIITDDLSMLDRIFFQFRSLFRPN